MNHGNRPVVLIVDDDPQVRAVYSAFLEDTYDIRSADSGSAALDVMDDDVDVVLLDRRMAGLSGSDTLQRFREAGFDQPVVLVTAVDPDFDILELGFDDYVVKPVDRGELRDLVETMLLRKEYDDVMREYFSLVSKVTALQTEKEPAELEADEGYRRSQQRLDDIKEQARAALDAAIEEGKFDALFRELSPSDTGADSGSGRGRVDPTPSGDPT